MRSKSVITLPYLLSLPQVYLSWGLRPSLLLDIGYFSLLAAVESIENNISNLLKYLENSVLVRSLNYS